MQRMTFNTFSHLTDLNLYISSLSVVRRCFTSLMFSSSHDGTILLLYADLFVGRVPLFALLLCVYVSPLMRFYSRTAVQMRTFHSIGTRAVPTTTSARRQIGQAGPRASVVKPKPCAGYTILD